MRRQGFQSQRIMSRRQRQRDNQRQRDRQRERKQKKMMDLYYGPYAEYETVLSKQMQVDFIINDKKQRNEVIMKILIAKQGDNIKLQLLSENDLFFYYQKILGYSDIHDLNSKFSMQLQDLEQLQMMLQKNMMQVQNKEKQLVFDVKSQKVMEMVITRQINHKIFLVFQVPLEQLSENQCNQMAAYRYGCLRQEIAQMEIKIKEVKQTVRAKNPYLLTFLNRL